MLDINLNSKNIIASQPKAWRYSKLSGLRMLKWLKSLPNCDADKAISNYKKARESKGSRDLQK